MIVPMKRMTLAAMRSEEGSIMEALQCAAAVEVIPPEGGGSDSPRRAAFEAQIQRLRSAQNALKPYYEKPSMLAAKPEATLDELFGSVDGGMELAERVEKLTAELNAAKSEAVRLSEQRLALEPWETLSTPLENVGSTSRAVLAAYIIREAQLEAVKAIDGLSVEVVRPDKKTAALVACHRDDWADAERQLKVLETQEVSFAGLRGTARDNILRLDGERQAAQKRAADAEKELLKLGESAPTVARAADACAVELDRVNAECGVETTDAVFLLDGWVRSDEVDKVEAALSGVTKAYYTEYRDPTDEEIPPSVVRNNKLIQPYEAVTNLYSRPDPRGIDGTPLMAFFYFLFFGMMLSDTGYGIVLSLGAWAYLRLKKPAPDSMSGGIVRVLFWGGISTAICGLFIGTFFGLDFDVLFGTSGVFPLFIDIETDSISMLILCFGLGLFHMLTGVVIGFIFNLKRKDYGAAIVDNLSWLFIIVGILLFAGPMLLPLPAFVSTVGLVMVALGGVTVLFFAGRGNKNIFGRLLGGAGKLYDITSYLSDMLSYARIFALGLSTGIIASVMNTLGGMIASAFDHGAVLAVIGYILMGAVLAFAHLFTLAINTLGTFIHTARLQYVEYFNKFYVAGGREFLPLKYRTKAVSVKDRAA